MAPVGTENRSIVGDRDRLCGDEGVFMCQASCPQLLYSRQSNDLVGDLLDILGQ
ncbi:hypothetical protein [Laspinema olomoucense]|uniref:hypothetical protein n=1 Tax=Laspinema olomoucense TaxID=3231600 RepID=UPI0021BAC205|nr:hypothetical protein [Laspinema sp. D3d]MCT7975643.1 hypothetical protein [Laspinema sp. D3d]